MKIKLKPALILGIGVYPTEKFLYERGSMGKEKNVDYCFAFSVNNNK